MNGNGSETRLQHILRQASEITRAAPDLEDVQRRVRRLAQWKRGRSGVVGLAAGVSAVIIVLVGIGPLRGSHVNHVHSAAAASGLSEGHLLVQVGTDAEVV